MEDDILKTQQVPSLAERQQQYDKLIHDIQVKMGVFRRENYKEAKNVLIHVSDYYLLELANRPLYTDYTESRKPNIFGLNIKSTLDIEEGEVIVF